MNDNQQKTASSEQLKDSASGGALPQKQMDKAQKAKATRQKLIMLSQAAKDEQKRLIANAETPEQQLDAASLTVNQIIMAFHKAETGCEDFRTFADWKKAGFSVNKGEKAYLVWGKPRRVKEEMTNDKGEKLEGDEWEFFPVCYLFNEQQVSPSKDKPDSEDKTETDSQAKSDEPAEEKPAEKPEENSNEQSFSPFVAVDYDERVEARRERLEERASNKEKASNDAYQRSHALTANIPFGQPILVGHHSERGHRRALDKSWSLMGKSVGLSKEADELKSRAAGVGTGGISSTDPEAVNKLKDKLQKLKKSQETMKSVNKALKRNDDAELQKLGLTEQQIIEIKKPDYAGRVGFPAYALQNNNAEIRRTQKRIEELSKLHNSNPIEFESDNFDMGIKNGQIVVDFHHGKPNEEARKQLKTNGFKWSRYQGAWVRKVTINAIYTAERVLENLNQLEAIY